MKMLSAAAATAVFTLALSASAAAGQSGGMSSGRAAPSVMLAPTPVPAPFRGFEPGNFPIPGLPPVPGGIDGRIFGPGHFPRPDHPGKPHDYFYGYGIGIGGVIDRDRGYFTTEGAAPQVVGGHVRYDYDRGYPYDHYSRAIEPDFAVEASQRQSYCVTKWTRGRRGGESVPVRICRN